MISSRSQAKSGFIMGSSPSSLACVSARAMDSEIGRPCKGLDGTHYGDGLGVSFDDDFNPFP